MIKLNKSIQDRVLHFGYLTTEGIPYAPAEITLQLAELVLPIYESNGLKNRNPRQAIAVVREYMANPTDENMEAVKQNPYSIKYPTHSYNWDTDLDPRPECVYHAETVTYYANRAVNPDDYIAYHAAYWAAHYAAKAIGIKQNKVKFQNIELILIKSNSWVQL
jgi:hypothetical protein